MRTLRLSRPTACSPLGASMIFSGCPIYVKIDDYGGNRAQVKRRSEVFQRINSRKEHKKLNMIDFISSTTNQGGGSMTGVVG